jgi:hypothetical protein
LLGNAMAAAVAVKLGVKKHFVSFEDLHNENIP